MAFPRAPTRRRGACAAVSKKDAAREVGTRAEELHDGDLVLVDDRGRGACPHVVGERVAGQLEPPK
eukprot:8698310-Prorocentrum_lima.AAC.1